MRFAPGVALSLLVFNAGCDSAPARSQLIGGWAILDHAPVGSREANCATDYAVSFEPDGKYGGYYESGTWALSANSLVITVKASNYANGGEAPEVPLIPPKQYNWKIMELNGPIARIEAPDRKLWLYRCEAKG